MELPRFVSLKSPFNDHYLRYDNEEGPFHGFLRANGRDLVTPFTKFEVVDAKCGNGLVNMRCCYNNKFWLRASPVFDWIVVRADEPQEDPSKWSCTLFKPIIRKVGDTQIVSFLHVQLNHPMFFETDSSTHVSCLSAGPTKPIPTDCDIFTVIDWDKMFVLPKHVAFKGDNGKYLRPKQIQVKVYLQFESNKLEDAQVGNTININSHGNIKVQSDLLIGGGVWTRTSDDWILANSYIPFIPPFIPGLPDHDRKIPPFVPGPVIPDHPNIPGDLPLGPGPIIPDHPKIPGDLPFGPGPVIPHHTKIPGDLPFGPGPVIPHHPKIPGDLPFGPGPVIPDHPKIPDDLPFGPGPVIPDHPKIPGDLPFGPGPVIPDHLPGDLPLPHGPGPVIPIPIPIFPDNSLFWPERVANNKVALRNLGNDKYCKRYTTTRDFINCLSAKDPSISQSSTLEVEEVVKSRRIEMVGIYMMDGRIYDHVDVVLATEEVYNKTDKPMTEDVKFSYSDTRSRCWKSSVSVKLHASITLKAGDPFVVDGKIELPNEEFRGPYKWGENIVSTTIKEVVYTVIVPPMSKVKVSLNATKASCDVPFSYSQHDILEKGQDTQEMDDGIYTGINYFDVNHTIMEETL